jgi:hypothetical protein
MLQLRIVPCLLTLLSLRLAAALTVPQELLHEQNDIYELDDDDLSVNTTDISAYDVSTLDFRSCETWDVDQWDYDVAIVGGGPAGLAASMSLGRVARTSLMYDSGQYRNARTRYMHDVLGQDGILHFASSYTKRQLIITQVRSPRISALRFVARSINITVITLSVQPKVLRSPPSSLSQRASAFTIAKEARPWFER